MARQERARRTREALLDLGAREFAALGYARTNLKTVARRAGVTSGALYGHFASKEELARALDREAVEHWSALREAVAAAGHPPEHGLAELTTGLLRGTARPRFRAALRLAMERWNAEAPEDTPADAAGDAGTNPGRDTGAEPGGPAGARPRGRAAGEPRGESVGDAGTNPGEDTDGKPGGHMGRSPRGKAGGNPGGGQDGDVAGTSHGVRARDVLAAVEGGLVRQLELVEAGGGLCRPWRPEPVARLLLGLVHGAVLADPASAGARRWEEAGLLLFDSCTAGRRRERARTCRTPGPSP